MGWSRGTWDLTTLQPDHYIHNTFSMNGFFIVRQHLRSYLRNWHTFIGEVINTLLFVGFLRVHFVFVVVVPLLTIECREVDLIKGLLVRLVVLFCALL